MYILKKILKIPDIFDISYLEAKYAIFNITPLRINIKQTWFISQGLVSTELSSKWVGVSTPEWFHSHYS